MGVIFYSGCLTIDASWQGFDDAERRAQESFCIDLGRSLLKHFLRHLIELLLLLRVKLLPFSNVRECFL
jgi:hypothetical protein